MTMPRISTAIAALAALISIAPVHAESTKSIAVTDLAYTQRVAEYFSAGKSETSSTLQAGKRIDTATIQSSGTYIEGTHSYLEQRELIGFSADVRSALLRGTTFRLIQGAAFDKGDPKLNQAERAFNAVNSGKVEPLKRQPEVRDVIDRIKKGEFNSADYVLFGTLTDIEFRDQFSPIQGTTNASQVFGADLVAEYTLINTKTYEIVASFSALGAGSDTKLISNRGDILPPNRPRVIRDASKSLAQDVFDQLTEQLNMQSGTAGNVRPPVSNVPSQGGLRNNGDAPPNGDGVVRYK
jgi:curli biogenesis system outer membrane secretion channel CsgG